MHIDTSSNHVHCANGNKTHLKDAWRLLILRRLLDEDDAVNPMVCSKIHNETAQSNMIQHDPIW